MTAVDLFSLIRATEAGRKVVPARFIKITRKKEGHS